MNVNENVRIEAARSLINYPYFIFNDLGKTYFDVSEELIEIKMYYHDYRKGAEFIPEGTLGDYVASNNKFKIAKTLIDKEARYMFSQEPDITIDPIDIIDGQEEEQIKVYNKLLEKVLEKSNFSKYLLQSAKDCFIGKRIALLVDLSEADGIKVHFYNSLQFYYEEEYDTDQLKLFMTFKCVNESKNGKERLFYINKYMKQNNKVYMESSIYNGLGEEVEILVPSKQIDIEYIPAVVITNDGTLEDKKGVSEMYDLTQGESTYSKLANADVDSENKGMNPIRYVVDMNSNTTKKLSSSAGSFWELKTEQNQNESHPMVGTLAPALNHTEAVKETLNRIKTDMYSQVDIPDISQEGLLSGITSFKALKALYFPLSVRCDEKMKTWNPALKFMVKCIIDLALINVDIVKSIYVLSEFKEIQYVVNIESNYALIDDEMEEKELDLQEINSKSRSVMSYLKKWRKDDLKTDKQREEELLQIAYENNLFEMGGFGSSPEIIESQKQKETKQIVETNVEEINLENNK